MEEISAETVSTFVLVEIDPKDQLGAPADPTGLQVSMAFIKTRNFGSTFPPPTFYASSWQKNAVAIPARFYAVCAIGTSTGVGALSPGVWYPFVQIVAYPETPLLAGLPFRVTP